MSLLAICLTVGWVITAVYIAARQGRSKARAATEALLLGPIGFLLLNYAKQARKK